MAQKRMFSLKVVDTDRFLDMPVSAQCLYFHLGMHGDDDGFVASPKRITAMCGCNPDDLKVLISKGFIYPFDSGVCVITDWKTNNTLKNDRYVPTIYTQEKNLLLAQNPSWFQNVSAAEPQLNVTKHNSDSLSQPGVGDEEDSSKKSKLFSHGSDAYKCARYLDRRICENLPTKKSADERTLQMWADAFDKVHRLDKQSWDDIADTLEFCQSDPFWKTNILSGIKFRKQFFQLLAKVRAINV